jgi:ABC-2 type transport system ATP-binding protein
MISIQDLSVRFAEKQVLHNISIEFEKGAIHGIVGLNGAGKTTFFNVLAKLLPAGNSLLKLDGKLISVKDTTYLETVNYFYPGITGNEYLKIFKQTNTGFKLAVLQDYFKLPLDDLIESYSTGMKKKLALLAVLKQDKPIYILDEPFNGLDLEANKILEIIIPLLKQKGKTVFISSHILDPLLTCCDKIHLLKEGIFVKTFDKTTFAQIDAALFDDLRSQAKQAISQAI